MEERKLTNKQKMFVKEYVKDLNASQAAKRANYAEENSHIIACQLMSKPNVKSAIDKELSKKMKKVEVDADYVLGNLKKVTEFCMNEDNFDSSGANKSLELLGKYLKLFTDKIETKVTNNPVDELIKSIDELKNKE